MILSPAAYRPNAAWVEAQANMFVDRARADGLRVTRVMHDRDSMFSSAFDDALKGRRVKILRSQFRAPNMNAYVERFVQSIKQECLDHFIVFGAQHMDYLCSEYLEYYHTERPHQGRGNELLVRLSANLPRNGVDVELPTPHEVRFRPRLGGLLKSYSRKAA